MTTCNNGGESDQILEAARTEILKWAQKRAEGSLPVKAWEGKRFEHLRGGRSVFGEIINNDNKALWALQLVDPDKNVANRIWTTEVVIGQSPEKIVSTVRLKVSIPSNDLTPDIIPAVPGLVRQLANKCAPDISTTPKYVRSEEDMSDLIGFLENTTRLPVVVVSGDDSHSTLSEQYLFNVEDLATAMAGLAHIYVLPAEHTFKLTAEFGRELSVFHGGVRIYRPGLIASDPGQEHPLFLGNFIRHDRQARRVRQRIARESLRTTRLGRDLISFTEI